MTLSTSHSQELTHAIEQGDVFRVQEILRDVNELDHDKDDDYLSHATQKGQLDIVKLLLPLYNTRNFTSEMIMAVREGHLEVVEFLLPMSNVKWMDSVALQVAAFYDQPEIFHVLYPLSDPQAALEGMIEDGDDDERTQILRDAIEYDRAQQIKQDIMDELKPATMSAKKKVM